MKVDILRSQWGICPPDYPKFSGICWIKPDGTLDARKVRDFAAETQRQRGAMVRILPWMVWDDWDNNGGTISRADYMPWVFENGKYNLEKLNPRYFDNVSEIVYILTGHGLWPIINAYDSCHGDRPGSRNVPWNNNHQGIGRYTDDTPTAWQMRDLWLRELIKAMSWYYQSVSGTQPVICPITGRGCTGGLTEEGKGEPIKLDWGISIGNEPRRDDRGFINVAVQASQILGDYPPWQRRWTGTRYTFPEDGWKEEGDSLYADTKLALRRAGWDREVRIAHGINEDFFARFRHIIDHTGIWKISDDGCSPKFTAEQWKKHLSAWLRPGRMEHLYIETLCEGPGPNFDACQGITEAVKEAGLYS